MTISSISQPEEDTPSLEDYYKICMFVNHREFVQVCLEAQAQAQKTGQKTHFWWRGYRGIVAANLPPITVPGMEVRLMNALHKVALKSTAETMVKKKYIDNYFNFFFYYSMYVDG